MPESPNPEKDTTTNALNRAEAMLSAGRIAGARRICETILRSHPSHVEANYLLGVVNMASGQPEAAHNRFETVTNIDPSHEDGWLRRGAALIALTRFTEAAASLGRLLALCPDDRAGLLHYGYSLFCLGDFAAAAAILQRAHAMAPEDDAVLFLYSTVSIWTAGPKRAMHCFELLTTRSPEFAAGWIGKGMLRLLLGEDQAGWPLMEWRLELPEHAAPARIGVGLRWHRGEARHGQTVLVHADASLGDIIQFCRFVPMAAAEGVRVVLRVPRSLVRLMRSLPAVDMIIADDDRLPPFELQCPIMSLPLEFDIVLATIPASVPYLSPPLDAVANWKFRMAKVPGLRVGLVWAGAARTGQITSRAFARRKSMSLATLAPLASVPGVTFVALQIGVGAQEIGQPPARMTLLDVTGEIADLADTAAIIASLDLVISIDTAVAHLAGAMGGPVWMMNVFDTDWRWMVNRDDSPWYPSMRIFRQPAPGDWGSVVLNVVEALRGLVSPDPHRVLRE